MPRERARSGIDWGGDAKHVRFRGKGPIREDYPVRERVAERVEPNPACVC